MIEVNLSVPGLCLDIIGAFYLARSDLFMPLKKKLEMEHPEWSGHQQKYIEGCIKSRWNIYLGIIHLVIGFSLQIISISFGPQIIEISHIVFITIVYTGFIFILEKFKNRYSIEYSQKLYENQ
ncbi:MAG: hypothetical protein ISR89_10185 [Candidatus Marinimicrobia bacterium]|nr:hypothetical protein [Candidatus Neomarinimicrobiota bacterium]MBL7031521.1 hypothetical protein [Candidatus Neomarinimicrobiota bacterium]